MKTNRYILIKQTKEKDLVYIDYQKLAGFQFSPKDKLTYDGVSVNKLILIKPSFVEKVLKKKIQKKLQMYLQYMIGVVDEDTGESEGKLQIALNDLSRYKQLVKNKYRQYLDDKFYNILVKKMEMLEQELKMKIYNYRVLNQENEKESGKSR